MKAVWIVVLIFGWCVGCGPAPQPLSSLQPVSTLAAATPVIPTLIPATATPTPAATAVRIAAANMIAINTTAVRTKSPAPTAILPTPTPLPTTIPTQTPVPEPTPRFLDRQVEAPFLETPLTETACGNEGTVYRSRFPSLVGGSRRFYHVYLPPCYGHDGRTYPVLYLFHGSIQTDSHWVDLGLAWHIDKGIQEGRYPPFIAIMPYNGSLGNTTSGNDHSIEGITVNYLIPYIDETYCTWAEAKGRSIGGISRGGYWALMIAFRHTDLFSAVSGHSSHLRYQTDVAAYNPLSTYAEADLSQMRIWLDWGEKGFLRPGQKQMHALLTKAHIPHDVTIYPGGHNDYYWVKHISDYLDWHTAVWPRDRDMYPKCEAIYDILDR